ARREGRATRAEVPRTELLRRKRVADFARVERVDPRVVVAGALLVVEDRKVALVQRFEQHPALRRIGRLEMLEQELRRDLKTRRAVMAHALVVEQRAVHVLAVQLEAARKRGAILARLR